MQAKHPYRVKFVKGTLEKWDQYVEVFDNSPLHEHYFKNDGFLKEWLYGPLEEGNVIVAETEDEGIPVGVMVYDMKGMFAEFPYLALLGVKDDYRGKMIGSRLVDLFVELSKKSGFDKCFVCCSHFNPRAKQLYQKKGFKPQVLIPDMIKKGINEWVLMKRF